MPLNTPGNSTYLSLGSNLGDRTHFLKEALVYISKIAEIISSSSVYETSPVGYPDQEDFLNMVVHIRTILGPSQFLKHLQKIEDILGRNRTITNGPRTIDVDILLFNDFEIYLPHLTVPHPRMLERAFILTPLEEIAPRLTHPTSGRSIATHLASLDTNEHITIWTKTLSLN